MPFSLTNILASQVPHSVQTDAFLLLSVPAKFRNLCFACAAATLLTPAPIAPAIKLSGKHSVVCCRYAETEAVSPKSKWKHLQEKEKKYEREQVSSATKQQLCVH